MTAHAVLDPPIELYLVRHAVAAERGSEWADDTRRPLTDKGIARFRQAVRGLAAIRLDLDTVVTSPLVRAVQTARLLASGLSSHPPVVEVADLAPGHPSATLLTALRKIPGTRLGLVGHEPDLGLLAAYLIGSRRPIPFRKGGVARIDVSSLTQAGSGTLRWLLTPRLLRQLA